MRLAIVAAGFTPGEADQLRRAMGAWRRPGIIDKLREKLLVGMTANGLTRDYAERIFEQIRGFGEYGFPESHAASFALLVYASAWLKLHYPAEFTASLLNSQPMGFYAPAQLIRDAQNHGVSVRPVDVNFSNWDSSIEADGGIRLGLRQVRGLSEKLHAAPLVNGRHGEPFRSIMDMVRRTGLTKAVLARLAAADAFQSLKVDRRESLWEVLALHEELPLFQEIDPEEPASSLEAMPLHEHVHDDYESTGLSLKAHPISLVRDDLAQRRVVSCADLAKISDGTFVRVAGLVLVRQRPETASGVTFMTLEDESGTANLILWPKVFERNRRAGKFSSALVAEGKVQKKDEIIHVIVSRLRDMTDLLPDLRARSRDFR